MSHETLIGTREAAERAGLPRSTFIRRVTEGSIPCSVKLPGRTGAMLFDPDVIDQLAREGVNQ